MRRWLSARSLVCGLALVTLLGGVRAGAQSATPTKKPVAVASANEDILKLTLAGMDESIILAKVAATDKSKFDTSADALLKLKGAGASQRVIAAMLGVTTAPALAPAPLPAPLPPPSASNQHVGVSFDQPSITSVDGVTEAGIYLVHDDGKLEQLEPTVYSGEASGGKYLHNVFGFIPENKQAVVHSTMANQRVQTARPKFYFFFENRGAGLSNTGGTYAGFMNGASSPNEFALARLKVSTDERQITVGKSSTIKDRVGIPSKDVIDVIFKKLRPGLYELQSRNPLTPGEYCFFYQGGAADKGGVGKLFDFGIDAGAVAQ